MTILGHHELKANFGSILTDFRSILVDFSELSLTLDQLHGTPLISDFKKTPTTLNKTSCQYRFSFDLARSNLAPGRIARIYFLSHFSLIITMTGA